jgi:hypothetical protein
VTNPSEQTGILRYLANPRPDLLARLYCGARLLLTGTPTELEVSPLFMGGMARLVVTTSGIPSIGLPAGLLLADLYLPGRSTESDNLQLALNSFAQHGLRFDPLLRRGEDPWLTSLLGCQSSPTRDFPGIPESLKPRYAVAMVITVPTDDPRPATSIYHQLSVVLRHISSLRLLHLAFDLSAPDGSQRQLVILEVWVEKRDFTNFRQKRELPLLATIGLPAPTIHEVKLLDLAVQAQYYEYIAPLPAV